MSKVERGRKRERKRGEREERDRERREREKRKREEWGAANLIINLFVKTIPCRPRVCVCKPSAAARAGGHTTAGHVSPSLPLPSPRLSCCYLVRGQKSPIWHTIARGAGGGEGGREECHSSQFSALNVCCGLFAWLSILWVCLHVKWTSPESRQFQRWTFLVSVSWRSTFCDFSNMINKTDETSFECV